MAAKHKKAELGRPPNEYTTKQLRRIEKMAMMQARDYTIAEAMGLEIMTFRKHFSKRCSQKRAEGKLILHTTQFKMARKQPVMAIWLGKQHLEQADKADIGGAITQRVAVNIIADGKVIKADLIDNDGSKLDNSANASPASPE